MRKSMLIFALLGVALVGSMITGGYALHKNYPSPTYLIGSVPANDYRVSRVIDGDTVEIVVPFLPVVLGDKIKVRILGVDTPEKGGRAKCAIEDAKSQKAKKFTEDAIASATLIDIQIYDWDKYGGRVLGDLILDGHKLSDMLISNGYAVSYHGEAKTTDWCKKG